MTPPTHTPSPYTELDILSVHTVTRPVVHQETVGKAGDRGAAPRALVVVTHPGGRSIAVGSGHWHNCW